jgi:multidrug efflux pump subunit AcrA (membrane-fusion protein)
MTVEQRVVETRETSGGWTPIVSGVKPGEKVVVSGIAKLAPGMKVALVEATGNEDLDKNFKPRIKE